VLSGSISDGREAHENVSAAVSAVMGHKLGRKSFFKSANRFRMIDTRGKVTILRRQRMTLGHIEPDHKSNIDAPHDENMFNLNQPFASRTIIGIGNSGFQGD
jgi:hypothetical protein